MITIKAGHIFCQLYNDKTGQHLTPKQIFCEVLAPMVFKTDKQKYLDYWPNFCMSPVAGNHGYGCNEYSLKKFVKNLEDDSNGTIMTMFKLWAGCANPFDTGGTTNYCINDNLNFSINERYESFIGAFFRIMISGGWCIVASDPNIIWTLWEGMKMYEEALEENDTFVGRQISQWNGICLYEKAYRGRIDIDAILDAYPKIKNGKKEPGLGTIPFVKVLFALSKIAPNLTYIEALNFGQKNKSCTPILLAASDKMNSIHNIYQSVFKNVDKVDFNFIDYSALFGWQRIFNRARELGAVTESMLDVEVNDKNVRYIIEYLKLTMNKETLTLCDDFAKALYDGISSAKHSLKSEIENLFSAKDATSFTNTLTNISEREGVTYSPIFMDMIRYMNGENVKVKQVLTYIKSVFINYKLSNNKK